MTPRAAILLLLLTGAIGAHAACPEAGGIGGTGISSDGGMGGTGISPQSRQTTEESVELAILGVITGFGSVCVNGVEVDYDAATPVTLAQAPASAGALAIGQVVAIRAFGSSERAKAERIDVLDGIVGRVTSFDRASGLLEIGAHRVHVAPGAMMDLPAQALAERPNVRVSGLWRADGTFAATRIDRASDDAAPRAAAPSWPQLGGRRLIAQGYVQDVRGSTVTVGGLDFELDARAGAAVRRDELVRLTARIENGRWMIERADRLRAPLESRPERSDRRDGGGERREGRDAERDNRGQGGGDRVERGNTTDRVDRSTAPERVDRSGNGRPERFDRPERGPDRPERVDRPDRPDRSGPH